MKIKSWWADGGKWFIVVIPTGDVSVTATFSLEPETALELARSIVEGGPLEPSAELLDATWRQAQQIIEADESERRSIAAMLPTGIGDDQAVKLILGLQAVFREVADRSYCRGWYESYERRDQQYSALGTRETDDLIARAIFHCWDAEKEGRS